MEFYGINKKNSLNITEWKKYKIKKEFVKGIIDYFKNNDITITEDLLLDKKEEDLLLDEKEDLSLNKNNNAN